MNGFKLCYTYQKKSAAEEGGLKSLFINLEAAPIEEVIVTISTLDKSVVEDRRKHEIYDYLRTNIAKIESIKTREGEERSWCYLSKNNKTELRKGNVVKFKHHDFDNPVIDESYLAYYSSINGALNHSKKVEPNYNGVRYHYYQSGSVKQKHCYNGGKLVCTYGYYDNVFNSLWYIWRFIRTGLVDESIYDPWENFIIQFVIQDDQIIHHWSCDSTFHQKSIYLSGKERNRFPQNIIIM